MRRTLLAGFMLFVLAVVTALEVPLGLMLQARQEDGALAFVRRASGGLAVLVGDALDHAEPARAKAVASRYLRQAGQDLGIMVVTGSTLLFRLGDTTPAELAAPAVAHAIHEVGSTSRAGKAVAAGSAVIYATALADAAGTASSRGRAVVVVTEPYSVVQDGIEDVWLKLAAFGAAVLAAAGALGLVISASMIRPLRRIEAAVAAIGEGDLAARAPTDRGALELRHLASALNAMAARLDRLLQAQRTFAANASHQLRTPLAAVRLRLERARDQVPVDATHDIDAALEELGRLARILNALLDLARTEAVAPARVDIDVDAVIAERIEAWRPLAEEQRLELSSGTSSPTPSESLVARACPSALDQVLDNLLANAFDATPAGGSVRVEAHRRGAFIEVHVLDDGRGLAPGEHEQAFDRFWRGSGAAAGGSGLGLAIVDHLLRASGGSAELRARAAGGTQAIVRLPAADARPLSAAPAMADA